MTTPYSEQAIVRIPTSPDDISMSTLLGICTSMKPALGCEGRSATRSVLYYTLNTLNAVYPDVMLLDLRDHPLPLFDGRMPDEHHNPALRMVWSCVSRAGGLLLAIPAYWSGVSGVFKNFVDTLCGPIYDMEDTTATVFADKPVGLLIIGADDTSTHVGVEQAQHIILSTGATLVGKPVTISNPRSSGVEASMLSQELVCLGAELARHVHLTVAGHER